MREEKENDCKCIKWRIYESVLVCTQERRRDEGGREEEEVDGGRRRETKSLQACSQQLEQQHHWHKGYEMTVNYDHDDDAWRPSLKGLPCM